MTDLGVRGNVMGPQPIARRATVPAGVREAADHFLQALMAGEPAESLTMAAPAGMREVEELAAAVPRGIYHRHEIIATARVNQHYYIKARLIGANPEPMVVQFRLGLSEGNWLVWEAVNLSGGRSGWTR